MRLNWTLHFLSFFKGCFTKPEFFVSDLENNTSTPAHDLCLEMWWAIEEVKRCCKAEGPDEECGKKL